MSLSQLGLLESQTDATLLRVQKSVVCSYPTWRFPGLVPRTFQQRDSFSVIFQQDFHVVCWKRPQGATQSKSRKVSCAVTRHGDSRAWFPGRSNKGIHFLVIISVNLP